MITLGQRRELVQDACIFNRYTFGRGRMHTYWAESNQHQFDFWGLCCQIALPHIQPRLRVTVAGTRVGGRYYKYNGMFTYPPQAVLDFFEWPHPVAHSEISVFNDNVALNHYDVFCFITDKHLLDFTGTQL